MMWVPSALDAGLVAAAEADAPEEPHSHDDPWGRGEIAPKFSIHGFADFMASVGRFKFDSGENDTQDTFTLGALDLYLVSHLAENISFLGEVVFENQRGDIQNNETAVDVERLVLKYTVSDRYWVALGRHHTPLGYWNEAFHHGLYLQPNGQRPLVVRFEDNGGLLPVHTVGVDMGGRWFRGAWGLDYEGGVANTRGITSQDVVTGVDTNDTKALTLRLTVSKEKDSRLLFGVTGHHDYIPPNPAVVGREGRMVEEILGGHLVFVNKRFEWYSEYYHIQHADQLTLDRTYHHGYFALGVWRAGKWKPYAGYDAIHVDPADLFYVGPASTLRRAIVGVRWDLHAFTALKSEYHHESQAGEHGDAVLFQSSFTF